MLGAAEQLDMIFRPDFSKNIFGSLTCLARERKVMLGAGQEEWFYQKRLSSAALTLTGDATYWHIYRSGSR